MFGKCENYTNNILILTLNVEFIKMNLRNIMIILFIRHAEAKKDKLTKYGKKQAKIIFKQPEDYEFSKIYSSPTKRCLDTAKIFNKTRKLSLELDERLKERETLSRSPQNKDEQLWYDNYMNPQFSNYAPEGCKELLERVYEFLGERIFEHYQKNENIVIVSHSGIFYAVMSYFNKGKKGNINWYKLGNCSKVYFEIK